MSTDWTADEMMTVAAARMLGDGTVCFVGIGLPSTAANLARRLHAPVIGTYGEPSVRFPGAGGAPEIAASAGEVIVIMRQTPRTFVPRCDFRTSVGYGDGPGTREKLGRRGRGPTVVITDLGVLRPDPSTCELTLAELHPGVTADDARAATGWDLRVADPLGTTDAPTSTELAALRELVAA